MHTATESSHSYRFQQDFSAIATPGLHRYLKERGYDPDEPSNEIDDCWESGKDYVAELFRGLRTAQSDYRDFGASPDLEVCGIEGWSREGVAAYVARRLEGILADVRNPVAWEEVVETGVRLDREYAAKEKSFMESLRAASGVKAPEALAPEPEGRNALLLSAWLRREIPPRDYLLGNVMSTTSRWLIYGETGVGKTLFAMDMAGAIASGRGFMNWEGSGVARRVMYLDGELPAETFKERMEIVARQYGAEVELYGYCRDVLGDNDMPPLNKPEGMKWLEKECRTVQPEVIMFDSIMCLLTGNMAEEESWAPVTPMLRQISQQRCAQLWLHHTGHDSSKGFGTKTREWQMDTVLSLTKDAQNGDHLLMEFKKARLRTPSTREQFEPLKIARGEDGWAIVGAAKKAGRPTIGDVARLERRILEAYSALSEGEPPQPGWNGKPVKKVPESRIQEWLLGRGDFLLDSQGRVSSKSKKDFQRAKCNLRDRSVVSENMGAIWRL